MDVSTLRSVRSERDELRDALVLLCLYDMAQERSPHKAVGDRLKAMKLAYLAANEMTGEGLHGLSFSFYRWTWGPLSNEVCDTWAALCRAGLLHEGELLRVTERGHRLALAFRDEVLKTKPTLPFLEVLERIAGRFGHQETYLVLREVYKLPQVTRAEKGDTVLTLEKALQELQVEESWLETMAVMLDPDSYLHLLEAEKDARAGRKVAPESVWR